MLRKGNIAEGDADMSFITGGGITIERTARRLAAKDAITPIIDQLDSHLGVLLTSSYQVPGRYTRWDVGFVDPPILLTANGGEFEIEARNDRGMVLIKLIYDALTAGIELMDLEADGEKLWGKLDTSTTPEFEEERSRRPSVFSVIRSIIELFKSADDQFGGCYGALGYDLAFQFEPIEHRLKRSSAHRDLVLYIPDRIAVVDHERGTAVEYSYEFSTENVSTAGVARGGTSEPFVGARPSRVRDHKVGEYAAIVDEARDWFRRGDLFEVVPSQVFFEECSAPPSEIFRRLRHRNPAPFGCLMNLGVREYLISASPEMFVRVRGNRVETCPISGTIARGDDAISDANQVLELLSSRKDAAELTMCTDVDRNDKSRVCVPGSVRLIGRRQIEMYSRVIHTVDHVEGLLRPDCDGIDAFLTHTWAVTVTGAPKIWAMRFIEQHEKSARDWYGGALGHFGFDGNVNTGLTLRTIRVADGVAEVRVGGTLLIDSVPEEEEHETEMKAAALLDAIRRGDSSSVEPESSGGLAEAGWRGVGKEILLIDHEDSFVHTLANYLRETGAAVRTLRVPSQGRNIGEGMEGKAPNLVVLSPGPGRPDDFKLRTTVAQALGRGLPVFGVCLGMQGIIEYLGGTLDVMDVPAHGRASEIQVRGGKLFDGLPRRFTAGRYHSLFATRDRLPDTLLVTAETSEGMIMAIEHKELPIAGVQFHPESLMTLEGNVGLRLLNNVVGMLVK